MEKRVSFKDYAIVACGTLNMDMIARRVLRARDKGAKITLADPRATITARTLRQNAYQGLEGLDRSS